MKRPHHYLVKMLIFLVGVSILCSVLFIPFKSAFMSNAGLNGLIIGVLFLGIIYNFRQVLSLYTEVDWIEGFKTQLSRESPVATVDQNKPPKLLAPMATMVDVRKNFSLSTFAMSALLDGISSRLDETRDTSRYTIGLLIFLGLLGTFWGLLSTVNSISDVIAGLDLYGNEASVFFGELKRGLQAPMSGMGTAFSSSLFGLAGSLILGFLDLQANQAQNRFYNDLEEWLSSVTKLSSGGVGSDGEQSVPAYVQALLEQTAESLENLQRTLAKSEEGRLSVSTHLQSVANKVEILTDHMRNQQALMKNLAESQIDLKPAIAKIANSTSDNNNSLDEATKTHIRNLDLYVGRITEEIKVGREDILKQIRAEIKLLARLVAAQATNTKSKN